MLRKFITFLTISTICTLDLVNFKTKPILAQTRSDTCIQGYVWREATPNDRVCVTPEIRTQTAEDNSAAASRIAPVDRTYGQFTCVQGYVWRVATPNDLVCVTPEIRSQAADDNSQASSRRVTVVPPIPTPYQFLGISNQSYTMARLDALNNARNYLFGKFPKYEYENQNLELNDIEINKDEGLVANNEWVSWVIIEIEYQIVTDCPSDGFINCKNLLPNILPVRCYFKDTRNCSRRK
jgi:hypothetical protein